MVLEKILESPLDGHCDQTSQSWNKSTLNIGKDPDAGKDWRQGEKGMTEDEIDGWRHWLNGHEFEQAPGVCDRQPGML